MQLTPSEQYSLYEEMKADKKAFFVYWNYSAKDIIKNIKEIYPQLNASSQGERQSFGDLLETYYVDDQEYSTNLESESHVFEIVRTINISMNKNNLTLVTFDSQGEDICFILIPLTSLPEYLGKGFQEV